MTNSFQETTSFQPALPDASGGLGIVTNSWKSQLDRGQSMVTLLSEARRRGFCVIELRQGFLGEYENDFANARSSSQARQRLNSLSREFIDLRLNLAVSLPCFGGRIQVHDPEVESAIAGAMALTAETKPHLRIVDTQTRVLRLDESEIASCSTLIARIANRMSEAGGSLSIEHGRQGWSGFWTTMIQARERLGASASTLRYCFDPCNLCLTNEESKTPDIIDALDPNDVSMIHLKQRHNSQIQPNVCEGDIAWSVLLDQLRHRGYWGPMLFEVAPHEQLWSNLERSTEFLFGKRG